MSLISYLKTVFASCIFIFCIGNCYAGTPLFKNLTGDSLVIISNFVLPDSIPELLPADSIKRQKKENKKLIAAILSFPIPFGVLGLHRIYLGTKPYIPFVYIGTVGGCFGILPLIDFITILTTKKENFKHFENNRKVFMWSH
jgi:TM2 domain-containing membrane protein YozV